MNGLDQEEALSARTRILCNDINYLLTFTQRWRVKLCHGSFAFVDPEIGLFSALLGGVGDVEHQGCRGEAAKEDSYDRLL